MQDKTIASLVEYCQKHLDLSAITLGNEYDYPNVPLCVIDAVFSIGVRYSSTENTVTRFCEFFGVEKISETTRENPDLQLSVSEFIKIYDGYGIDGMTKQVYRNRQRTSTRSGILKSEAVLRFSETLSHLGVENLQDMKKVQGNEEFEAAIKKIPGQRSGISLRYFYMLAGSENYIKPDRMINRFIYQATGKTYEIEEATELLIEASKKLAEEYPGLTPRTLDNVIWQYQRSQ